MCPSRKPSLNQNTRSLTRLIRAYHSKSLPSLTSPSMKSKPGHSTSNPHSCTPPERTISNSKTLHSSQSTTMRKLYQQKQESSIQDTSTYNLKQDPSHPIVTSSSPSSSVPQKSRIPMRGYWSYQSIISIPIKINSSSNSMEKQKDLFVTSNYLPPTLPHQISSHSSSSVVSDAKSKTLNDSTLSIPPVQPTSSIGNYQKTINYPKQQTIIKPISSNVSHPRELYSQEKKVKSYSSTIQIMLPLTTPIGHSKYHQKKSHNISSYKETFLNQISYLMQAKLTLDHYLLMERIRKPSISKIQKICPSHSHLIKTQYAQIQNKMIVSLSPPCQASSNHYQINQSKYYSLQKQKETTITISIVTSSDGPDQ